MNDNFVYDEFNPKMKGGRASGVTEIFQATNSYIRNNIKPLFCFALVYIVLIGGFLALNVGSIMSISSDVLKYNLRNSEQFETGINGLEDFTDELEEAEDFDDVMRSIGRFRGSNFDKSIRNENLNFTFEILRTSTLMILGFLAMGILIQLIGIAFVTHVNKWIFKMDRGVKDVAEAVFIKFIKSIAIAIVFGLITGATAVIFGIFSTSTESYEAIVIIMTIVLVLVNFYISIAGGFAQYLVTTNKYTGIGTCISTGFGLANRFLFNWIGKMLLIIIGIAVIAGLATVVIALLATGLRSPWIMAITTIPWIIGTLYSSVYSQVTMCDYTNQYEFRTGNVVRDYDYYDIYDDDGYDYTDRPKRYQDDEARSVDDFYNNLGR